MSNFFHTEEAEISNDHELLSAGMYQAKLENAVYDDFDVWENGQKTGQKVDGIALTFRITSDVGTNRKLWKNLKFNNDDAREKSKEQLTLLGVWSHGKKGKTETESIQHIAHGLQDLVETKTINIWVSEWEGRNYPKVKGISNEVVNHAAGITPGGVDTSEELPF